MPKTKTTDDDAPVDPLSQAWNQLATKLLRAPDIVTLPRAEIIRLCRCFFYVGAASAILPVMEGWHRARNEGDLALLREITFAIGESVANHHPDDDIGKLLATMEAHAS